jgi:hypothetical protein
MRARCVGLIRASAGRATSLHLAALIAYRPEESENQKARLFSPPSIPNLLQVLQESALARVFFLEKKKQASILCLTASL